MDFHKFLHLLVVFLEFRDVFSQNYIALRFIVIVELSVFYIFNTILAIFIITILILNIPLFFFIPYFSVNLFFNVFKKGIFFIIFILILIFIFAFDPLYFSTFKLVFIYIFLLIPILWHLKSILVFHFCFFMFICVLILIACNICLLCFDCLYLHLFEFFSDILHLAPEIFNLASQHSIFFLDVVHFDHHVLKCFKTELASLLLKLSFPVFDISKPALNRP